MTDALIQHLDTALGAILAARVQAGSIQAPDLPDEALQAALGADDNYQLTRVTVRDALGALQAVMDTETWNKVLQLEAVMNASMAEAVEVAWTLAWKAAAGR